MVIQLRSSAWHLALLSPVHLAHHLLTQASCLEAYLPSQHPVARRPLRRLAYRAPGRRDRDPQRCLAGRVLRRDAFLRDFLLLAADWSGICVSEGSHVSCSFVGSFGTGAEQVSGFPLSVRVPITPTGFARLLLVLS